MFENVKPWISDFSKQRKYLGSLTDGEFNEWFREALLKRPHPINIPYDDNLHLWLCTLSSYPAFKGKIENAVVCCLDPASLKKENPEYFEQLCLLAGYLRITKAYDQLSILSGEERYKGVPATFVNAEDLHTLCRDVTASLTSPDDRGMVSGRLWQRKAALRRLCYR